MDKVKPIGAVIAVVGARQFSGDTRFVTGKSCAWWGPIAEAGKLASGIPCCPHCSSVLYETANEASWWASVERKNPGDRAMVEWSRGRHFATVDEMRHAYANRPEAVCVAELEDQLEECRAASEELAKVEQVLDAAGRPFRDDGVAAEVGRALAELEAITKPKKLLPRGSSWSTLANDARAIGFVCSIVAHPQRPARGELPEGVSSADVIVAIHQIMVAIDSGDFERAKQALAESRAILGGQR